MRCLHQCWFLKKDFYEGKQLIVLPPWLHPVYDVAKASLVFSQLTFLRPQNEVN